MMSSFTASKAVLTVLIIIFSKRETHLEIFFTVFPLQFSVTLSTRPLLLSGLYHFLIFYYILFYNKPTGIGKTLTKLTHRLYKSILRGNFYDKCNFVSLVYCPSVLYLFLLISNSFLENLCPYKHKNSHNYFEIKVVC